MTPNRNVAIAVAKAEEKITAAIQELRDNDLKHIETRLDGLETKVDGLETKVDEVLRRLPDPDESP